jgi:hypothetical protein
MSVMSRPRQVNLSRLRTGWYREVAVKSMDAHTLQPHRVRRFKLSRDPEFVPKLREIIGLYIDPPAHAIVLSVDERAKSRRSTEPSRVCR